MPGDRQSDSSTEEDEREVTRDTGAILAALLDVYFFFYFNLSSQLGLLRYVWFQQRPRFSFSIACGKEGGKDCWIIHVTDSHFLLFLTDKLLPRTDCSTIVLVSQFCLCCW